MVALAWAVNVKPETLAAIAFLTARAVALESTLKLVRQLVEETAAVMADLGDQLAAQNLSDDMFAMATAAAGAAHLGDLLASLGLFGEEVSPAASASNR